MRYGLIFYYLESQIHDSRICTAYLTVPDFCSFMTVRFPIGSPYIVTFPYTSFINW